LNGPLEFFSGLRLDESFVLDIVTTYRTVRVILDLVLTSDHPDYQTPPPSDAFCFR
jgi:hypothetical protein